MELNRLIGAGNEIRNEIRASPPNDAATHFHEPIGKWLQEAWSFLEVHFPGYTEHFRSEVFSTQGTWVGNPERSERINFLDRRIARLLELLNK